MCEKLAVIAKHQVREPLGVILNFDFCINNKKQKEGESNTIAIGLRQVQSDPSSPVLRDTHRAIRLSILLKPGC